MKEHAKWITTEAESKKRAKILRKVIVAGGEPKWSVWDVWRYAEDLGRHSLDELENMTGENIRRIMEREIEKVYKSRH